MHVFGTKFIERNSGSVWDENFWHQNYGMNFLMPKLLDKILGHEGANSDWLSGNSVRQTELIL